MTVFTGIGRDSLRGWFAARQRGGCRGQLGGRTAVSGTGPPGFDVAANAQRGSGVIHHQELSELIVVRVMASDALQLLKVIELELFVQGQRVAQVIVQRGEVL